MIVCVCNVISDQDIKQAVVEGADSLEQLEDRLNVGVCCGICTDSAKQCLLEALVHKPSPQLVA